MIIDKDYCMSAFLRYRLIFNRNYAWGENIVPQKFVNPNLQTVPVHNIQDMDTTIKRVLEKNVDSNTGIMLSGGMDSAILATYMPKGSIAYTMRCVAEGSLNEVEYARKFAEINGLELRIVDITWEDIKRVCPILMKSLKAPFHSIQPLIYRVCEDAKNDGLSKLVCGETADLHFGGLDGLLSKDWTFDEFVERYTFLNPEIVLKHPIKVLDDLLPYKEGNKIDVHKFLNKYFAPESAMNDYLNPSTLNNIDLIMPYSYMTLAEPLDLERIRNGENKYLIRELFAKRYKGIEPNKKLPMPRAVGIWLQDWEGPSRSEFKPFDINTLKPDQKWLIYILEQFLNLLDEGEI